MGMGGTRAYTSAAGKYRYGFNGKETDPETNDVGGGTQDYGMRIYNPAIGRFLSVDPLTTKYPNYSPYLFAGNNPVYFIDGDGQEQIEYLISISKTGEVSVKVLYYNDNWFGAFDYKKVVVSFEGMTTASYYFTPWGTNADGTPFAPSGGGHNNLDQFDDFIQGLATNPVGTLTNSNFTSEQQIRDDDVSNLAITLVLGRMIKQRESYEQPSNKKQTSANNGVNNNGEKKLEVGPYNQMSKANAKSGKSADHIPSFAALKAQTESILGRKLTSIEAKSLRDKSLAVVYETQIHQAASRTYGGRNHQTKIAEDAANLYQAVKKDVDALKTQLIKAGYSEKEINEAAEKLLEPYKPKNE